MECVDDAVGQKRRRMTEYNADEHACKNIGGIVYARVQSLECNKRRKNEREHAGLFMKAPECRRRRK